MRSFRFLCALLIAGALLAIHPPQSHAQISVQIGPAPVCPYGYYGYSPYQCAPYGYYGPQWFPNGIFIGAGPWFHGPRGFRGPINYRYDVRRGYHGRLPRRGERARRYRNRHFRGNAWSDGRGHIDRGRQGRRR